MQMLSKIDAELNRLQLSKAFDIDHYKSLLGETSAFDRIAFVPKTGQTFEREKSPNFQCNRVGQAFPLKVCPSTFLFPGAYFH